MNLAQLMHHKCASLLTSSDFALVHKQLLDGEMVILAGLKAEAGVVMQDDVSIGVVDSVSVACASG